MSQFDYQLLGAESPFPGSSSTLAGFSFLISLSLPTKVNKLVDALCDRLTYEILHLEIEVEGVVQFAAFDHFGYILFGDKVSLTMLENLKTLGVIDRYDVFDDQETIK